MEESESILYDRTKIGTDWSNDLCSAEVQNEIEQSWSALSAVTERLSALLRYSGLTSQAGCNLPERLVKIISQSNPWQVSISPCGTYLAILRRNHLELRSAHDGFTFVKETQITRDKHPEWRKIFWSSKGWFGSSAGSDIGSILAVSLSSGKVFLFDICLSIIKRIDPEKEIPVSSYSSSVAAVVFPDSKLQNRNGLRYCSIIYRNGNYSIYRIDAKINVLLVKSSMLDTPNGVEDFVWSPRHQLFGYIGWTVSW
jgi:hypothetical protein